MERKDGGLGWQIVAKGNEGEKCELCCKRCTWSVIASCCCRATCFSPARERVVYPSLCLSAACRFVVVVVDVFGVMARFDWCTRFVFVFSLFRVFMHFERFQFFVFVFALFFFFLFFACLSCVCLSMSVCICLCLCVCVCLCTLAWHVRAIVCLSDNLTLALYVATPDHLLCG